MSSVPFLGIDFGTSKSSMAWYDPGIKRAQIILNKEGYLETPSVVYLGPGENSILVGEPAELKLKQKKADQRRFVLSVKRDLLRAAPKILDEDNKVYTPVQIASFILRKLREDAETRRFNKQTITHAVITHPARFGVNQRDKIKEAALLAGFSEVALLPEPEAAALAYGYAGLEVGKSILVYDFGGGTFDVAVLARTPDGGFKKSVARDGLERCGGDDLDLAIYLHCEKVARQEKRRSISLTEEPHLRFLRLCRECKHNLTSQQEYTFSDLLDSQSSPEWFEHTLERSTFEGLVQDIVGETVTLTQKVIQKARDNNCQVDTVVLIGGSSQVPLVKRSLTNALPVQPHEWEHQYTAVALGAAYYAQQLWGTPAQKRTARPRVEPSTSGPEAYRKVVKAAWTNQKLTQAQADGLSTYEQMHHLSREEAMAIEREVMGASKEDIVLHQNNMEAYRNAVKLVQASPALTQAHIDGLNAQANHLRLSSYDITTIEREVMGAPKEDILLRQRLEQQAREAEQARETKRKAEAESRRKVEEALKRRAEEQARPTSKPPETPPQAAPPPPSNRATPSSPTPAAATTLTSQVRTTKNFCSACVWLSVVSFVLAVAIGNNQPNAASVIAVADLVLLFIAWVLALVNSARLERWAWFTILFLSSWLLLPLIIYTLAGPVTPPAAKK